MRRETEQNRRQRRENKKIWDLKHKGFLDWVGEDEECVFLKRPCKLILTHCCQQIWPWRNGPLWPCLANKHSHSKVFLHRVEKNTFRLFALDSLNGDVQSRMDLLLVRCTYGTWWICQLAQHERRKKNPASGRNDLRYQSVSLHEFQELPKLILLVNTLSFDSSILHFEWQQ